MGIPAAWAYRINGVRIAPNQRLMITTQAP